MESMRRTTIAHAKQTLEPQGKTNLMSAPGMHPGHEISASVPAVLLRDKVAISVHVGFDQSEGSEIGVFRPLL